MEDIVSLGLAVVSADVATADQRLVKLTATAGTTERATKSLAAATVDLGAKAETTARRLSQYDDAHAKSARTAALAADATNRAATAQAAAMRTAGSEVARQYDMMTSAAQRYATEMVRTVDRMKIAEAYQASISLARTYTGEVGKAVAQTTALAAAQSRVAQSPAAVGYMGRPGQVGLNAQQRVMLGYQIQDVFTSLASGMNPAVVAAQQGPQISMLYGGMGNMFRAIPRPLLVGAGAVAGIGAGLYGLNTAAESQDARLLQDRRFGTLFGTGTDGAGTMRDIRAMAASVSIGVDKATESVEGFAKATRGLGASRQDIVGIAAEIEKLAKLGGANDNEADAAREGVAGMLKSATVSADQLKTVLTNVPGIAGEIAAGLGVSVTQLRLMAEQGDLTNRKVLDAMLARSSAVNDQFAAMPKSVGDLFSSIATDLGTALKNLADSIPLVNQYRNALELAAKAAKGLKEAGTPESNASIIARTNGLLPGGASSDLSPQTLAGRFAPDPLGAQRGGAVGNSNVLVQKALEERTQALRNLHAQMRLEEKATADAAKRAADEIIANASTVARKFDDLSNTYRQNQRDIEAMEKALDVLQQGLTNLSAEEAANQVGILTGALQRAREAAQNIDPALKSLNDISRRNEFRANDNTPAGMALQQRTQELVNQGSNRQDAENAALAEQQERIADIIKAKQDEAAASDKITAAMGRGKRALIEAQTEAAVLAFIMANVGNNTEVATDQIKAFRDAVKTILTNESAQAGINASKPLLDDLAAIAAAMKVVEQGAYAMKQAEAEARAARDENGTGTLQMQVFDARQKLTDATTLDALRQEIDLTNKLAAAAGDVAKQKAIQLDYDIKKAQQNADPTNREKIAEEMRAKAAADVRRETAEGAVEIEKQVELTKQQAEIVRSGNADYAAQLAMLQKKNELLAKGVDLASEEAQRQITGAGNLARANVDLDRAKEAADATKRIWQNAFDGVQSYGADVFFDIFRGVPLDGKTAADALKNIFLRTFAEIAAAAVIRPIIAPIFNAVGSVFGGGAAMPAAIGAPGGLSMPSIGGGGIGNLFSGSGWLGGIGDWLHTPLTGPYAGMSPSSMAGVPMLSPSLSNPSTWGITPMQGLGALAGAGMGIYNLANSKSTGQTIGGIASLIGAGVSLIPGVGQIAGPIIGLLGGLLPGLFGGDEQPKLPPISGANAAMNWNPAKGGYGFSESIMNGGSSIAGSLKGPAKSMADLYKLAGGVVRPESVYGVSIWNNERDKTGSSYIIGPNGFSQKWGQGSTEKDIGADAATAFAAWKTLTEAVDLSAKMKKALEQIAAEARSADQPFSFQELSQTVSEVKSLEDALNDMGKSTSQAEAALQAVDDRFTELFNTAKKYGFDTGELDQAKAKARFGVARDFANAIDRQLMSPGDAAMFDIAEERRLAYENNEALKAAKIPGYVDQGTKIEEIYQRKRLEIMEQGNKDALDAQQKAADAAQRAADAAKDKIQSLQDVIDRLTYGDLSNASPEVAYAGAKATYMATLAQANAGDAASIDRLAGVTQAYAQAGRSFNASGSDYVSQNVQMRTDLRDVQGVISRGVNGGNNEMLNQLLRTSAKQAAMIDTLINDNEQSRQKIADLVAQLQRRAP